MFDFIFSTIIPPVIEVVKEVVSAVVGMACIYAVNWFTRRSQAQA
jgi:hypothetical protein